MTTKHSPLQIFCLVVNFLVVVLTTVVAFTILGRQYQLLEAIPGLFRNDLQKVAEAQPSPISPPQWLHCTWGVILVWQVVWAVHGLASICRTTFGFPVYTNPVLLTPLMLVLFMFACGFNVSWFILYDRLYTSTSCLFVFLMTSTAWTAYGLSLTALNFNYYRMQKTSMECEVCVTRVLVQNGLAAYAMWGVFVLAFNVAVALIHNTHTHTSENMATIVAILVIACAQLIYLAVDVVCLDDFSRYIITPYFIPIIVLAACLFRQEVWFSTDINFILLTTLLAFAFLSLMAKSAWTTYKIIRNNTGGGDITGSGPSSPVNESYYLLK
ncbi:unnamed protein product [Candidula unifasciata]|uniref:Uncharacterized protein n=1 Tax=Candidula unifasciata TaxID=100452 RepID=A0A8S3ZR85_9EUPU|nr:unnamed protein product [Candidula unifasciata]